MITCSLYDMTRLDFRAGHDSMLLLLVAVSVLLNMAFLYSFVMFAVFFSLFYGAAIAKSLLGLSSPNCDAAPTYQALRFAQLNAELAALHALRYFMFVLLQRCS